MLIVMVTKIGSLELLMVELKISSKQSVDLDRQVPSWVKAPMR